MLKVTVDAEKLTTWANGLSVPVGNLIRLATEAESERLIGSIRRECLDHVVVFGERHLRHVLLPYMNYYDETRTQIFGQGCSPIAHRKEGRAYSLPPSHRRIASRICPDLISDRHTGQGQKSRFDPLPITSGLPRSPDII